MTKKVPCTHCAGELEVAERALSTVCPHCQKRLVLESFRIRTHYAVRLFGTCGDIFVEKRGQVVATIRADNVTVNGRVRGDVTARGRVKIGPHGSLKGNITAPRLQVESGAALNGYLRIDAGRTRPSGGAPV